MSVRLGIISSLAASLAAANGDGLFGALNQWHDLKATRLLRDGSPHRHLSTAIGSSNDQAKLEHEEETALELSFKGTKVTVDLSQNRNLFTTDYKQMRVGGGAGDITSEPELCHYQGVTRGQPGSFAAISTCGGRLRGYFTHDGTLHYVEPSPLSHRTGIALEEHVVYTQTDLKPEPIDKHKCGVVDANEPNNITPHGLMDLHHDHDDHEGASAPPASKRALKQEAAAKPKRWVKMSWLNDVSVYAKYGVETENVAASYVNMAAGFYTKDDLFDYEIILVLVSQTTFTEQSSMSNRGEGYSLNMLKKTCAYRENYLSDTDVTHFFSVKEYGEGMRGLAYVGTVCEVGPSGACAVNEEMNTALLTTLVIAHELGHNLDSDHDSSGKSRACTNRKFVMSSCPQCVDDNDEWSQCSIDSINNYIRSPDGVCMQEERTAEKLAVCGNGVLEFGEECDCGSLDDCKDPCCIASSCRLVAQAVCSQNDECCHNCQVAQAGTPCGADPLRHNCDAQDYCDGNKAICPDLLQHSGVPCPDPLTGELNGRCHEGHCHTTSHACHQLPSVHSEPAEACAAEVTTCFAMQCKQPGESCQELWESTPPDGTPCNDPLFGRRGHCMRKTCVDDSDITLPPTILGYVEPTFRPSTAPSPPTSGSILLPNGPPPTAEPTHSPNTDRPTWAPSAYPTPLPSPAVVPSHAPTTAPLTVCTQADEGRVCIDTLDALGFCNGKSGCQTWEGYCEEQGSEFGFGFFSQFSACSPSQYTSCLATKCHTGGECSKVGSSAPDGSPCVRNNGQPGYCSGLFCNALPQSLVVVGAAVAASVEGCPTGGELGLPCSGKGQCNPSSLTCQCETGFQGDNCEEEVLCPTAKNSGLTCNGPSNGVCELGSCRCTKSCLAGPACDTALSSCPSVGGAACADHGACDQGQCSCTCNEGWYGPMCVQPSCPAVGAAAAPCSNHGACGVVDGNPQCICDQGHAGTHCETSQPNPPPSPSPGGVPSSAAGEAHHIQVLVQPSGSLTAGQLATSPMVRLLDAFNNTIAGSPLLYVTAHVEPPPLSVDALAAAAPVTPAGVALFHRVAFSGFRGQKYRLRFQVTGQGVSILPAYSEWIHMDACPGDTEFSQLQTGAVECACGAGKEATWAAEFTMEPKGCRKCPAGTYSATLGREACTVCPEGKSTSGSGAKGESECRVLLSRGNKRVELGPAATLLAAAASAAFALLA